MKIKGKPGTRKCCVVHTLWNIIKLIMTSNICDEATNLTGCADSLIYINAHSRILIIQMPPKKFHNTTKNVVISNTDISKH